MSDIPAKLVKKLREETGAGFMDVKKALLEAGGDEGKAKDILRQKGAATAEKKSGRTTGQGWIGHYVHTNGRIGVLIEVMCETDFVAKNDTFQELIKDLSMQVAALDPMAVRPEELPAELVEQKRNEFLEQVKDKPENVQEKIVEGKLGKFFSEVCLLHMPFVKGRQDVRAGVHHREDSDHRREHRRGALRSDGAWRGPGVVAGVHSGTP